MQLLITTQILDRSDPVLGFFHAWVAALAKECEQVTVIALSVGEHSLPGNVAVRSLGKENGRRGKLTYAATFQDHLRELDGTYDAVFVHMNPEYVLLGFPFWRGKKVALWYNHDHGGWKLKLASYFVDALLHTSPYAASAGTKKSQQMPAGIDTQVFRPQGVDVRLKSIYFQGRVSRSKRVHVLLEALRSVPGATVTLVGPAEPSYEAMLRSEFKDLIYGGRVTFYGPVPNAETPALYAAHAVSVNLTAAGNYDKSVLESIACGTPALVSSPAFADLVPEPCYFKENDPASLAETLRRILALSSEERRMLTDAGSARIHEEHSLGALTRAILEVYRRP
ncbi:MAG TPA: glycosyltransferase family 4 protein [Candidatus Paceibacterota bacterium]|nr:glycosyltransferase family 4 protein [Candidatus Paceibacterota bacterium]